MTISELCLAIKDRRINEKTIKQWESSKAYPDLDMCYKLAYILEINPNELLWIRNYERKKFKVKKSKTRTFWNAEVPDEFFWAMKGVLGLILILIAFYVIANYLKLQNAVLNGGGKEFDQILVNEVDKGINQIQNEVEDTYNIEKQRDEIYELLIEN